MEFIGWLTGLKSGIGSLAANGALLNTGPCLQVVDSIDLKTKAVVYWGAGEPKDADKSTLRKAKVPLYSFQEFLDLGASKPADPVPPKPDDNCTIMYTRCARAATRCMSGCWRHTGGCTAV